jgi:hypothetical protein
MSLGNIIAQCKYSRRYNTAHYVNTLGLDHFCWLVPAQHKQKPMNNKIICEGVFGIYSMNSKILRFNFGGPQLFQLILDPTRLEIIVKTLLAKDKI